MNAVDILKYGHRTLLKAIDGLPEADWYTTGAVGVWSTKDIIAHLASFEHVLVDLLNSFLGGGPTPYLDRYRGPDFNETEVPRWKDMTVREVMAEYTATQARTMELAAKIPAEKLREVGTLPWYGMEYSLDDFIVYTYYGHKREHAAQIGMFRDRLEG